MLVSDCVCVRDRDRIISDSISRRQIDAANLYSDGCNSIARVWNPYYGLMNMEYIVTLIEWLCIERNFTCDLFGTNAGKTIVRGESVFVNHTRVT